MAQAPASDSAETVRRFLVILALSLWFGGFTFYSLVVIHTGHRVFDSQEEVGFLTQAVTNWLNLIGIAAIGVMLWDMLAVWKRQGRAVKRALISCWVVITGIEVALFLLHPRLDALLDQKTRSVIAGQQFRSLHHWYLNLSTAQWACTLVYLWAMVAAWRTMDRGD